MRFPLIIYKDTESSYGGILPDFPACYPMGETLDELLGSVQDAVETWMVGEPPETFPQPSSLDAAYQLEEAQGKTLFLVEVDTSFLEQSTKRINITVPSYALRIIDKAAQGAGQPRSAFLVQAALDKAVHV